MTSMSKLDLLKVKVQNLESARSDARVAAMVTAALAICTAVVGMQVLATVLCVSSSTLLVGFLLASKSLKKADAELTAESLFAAAILAAEKNAGAKAAKPKTKRAPKKKDA